MAIDEEISLFRRKVGNTPMLRCRHLEKRLGLKELHLKLEGTNPTGHKSDRIAHRIVRDAHQRGKGTITLGTVGYLARSLSVLSEPLDMRCVLFVPEATGDLAEYTAGNENIQVVETGGTWEDSVLESRRRAEAEGWYDANPGLENTLFGMIAYSPMASELVRKLRGSPDTVSMAVGTGALMSGLHLGFRQQWSSEEIDTMPHLLGGSLEGANAITESFQRGLKEVEAIPGDPGGVSTPLHPLINLQALFGQSALEAIYDTGGAGYSLPPDQLEEMAKLLRHTEQVELTVDSAAALGAFMGALDAGLVDAGGKHVVVLSTGRTDLTIRELSREDIGGNLDQLINVLDRWLEDFTDPRAEILEAVENALDSGYVLAALADGGLIGLCVLSTMELDTFFPRYHLSYIAADSRYEGRGVATLLLDKAVELSNGNLSLHVERDNKKAIRLYQKMGFDIKYHRMQYKSGGSE